MVSTLEIVNPVDPSIYTMVSVWVEPGKFFHIVDIDGTWLAKVTIGNDALFRVMQYVEENDLKVDEVSIAQFPELEQFGE